MLGSNRFESFLDRRGSADSWFCIFGAKIARSLAFMRPFTKAPQAESAKFLVTLKCPGREVSCQHHSDGHDDAERRHRQMPVRAEKRVYNDRRYVGV